MPWHLFIVAQINSLKVCTSLKLAQRFNNYTDKNMKYDSTITLIRIWNMEIFYVVQLLVDGQDHNTPIEGPK